MANLTSNGQITARDIRQDSVKNLHLTADSVDTAELVDLAVTVAKNTEVVDWDAGGDQSINVTIDTTWAVHASADIVVPSWAGIMALSTFSLLQATITADTVFNFWTTIDQPGEAPSGAFTEELAMTGVRHLNHTRYWEASVTPGSTITSEFWIRTTSGSNTANVVRLEAVGFFRR